jgi:hypothetical protein
MKKALRIMDDTANLYSFFITGLKLLNCLLIVNSLKSSIVFNKIKNTIGSKLRKITDETSLNLTIFDPDVHKLLVPFDWAIVASLKRKLGLFRIKRRQAIKANVAKTISFFLFVSLYFD